MKEGEIIKMNKHCIICKTVEIAGEWIGAEEYRSRGFSPPTSGIYHKECLELYFTHYVSSIPEEDKQAIRSQLEEKL